MDLDSELQTSQFVYIYSFSRGIQFFWVPGRNSGVQTEFCVGKTYYAQTLILVALIVVNIFSFLVIASNHD